MGGDIEWFALHLLYIQYTALNLYPFFPPSSKKYWQLFHNKMAI